MSKLLVKIEKRIQANKEAAWYENNLLLLKIRDGGFIKKSMGLLKNIWRIVGSLVQGVGNN